MFNRFEAKKLSFYRDYNHKLKFIDEDFVTDIPPHRARASLLGTFGTHPGLLQLDSSKILTHHSQYEPIHKVP